MIDTKARKYIQPFFNSLGRGLLFLKLTPNGVTVLSFVIGVMAALCIVLKWQVAAIILLWLSGLLDVLDGTMARLTNQSSKIGAYMDLVLDRMVEASIILGLYLAYPEYAFAYLLFFVAVLFNFTTFLVAGSMFPNEGEKSMHYDVGLAERTETFIVFTALIIFSDYIQIILMGFNIIIFMTGIIRFKRVIEYAKGKEDDQ